MTPVPDELIQMFILAWNHHNERKVTRWNLNFGWCYHFALLLKRFHGDTAQLQCDWHHAWVEIDGKLYDSDRPRGVCARSELTCSRRDPDRLRLGISEEEFIAFWETGGSGPVQLRVIEQALHMYRVIHQ